jgi:hypothetical protein
VARRTFGQSFRAIFTTGHRLQNLVWDPVFFARQGKDDDETNENQDEENEDASFWPDSTTAHQRLAQRMCGEKTLLNLHAAVGYAVYEHLHILVSAGGLQESEGRWVNSLAFVQRLQ